jgi:adenosylcobyric acid synthase
MAKAIMVQGTMSNAGKSLVTAGLCRIFKQDGYKVAPFKSQNMALNSYITREGFEMGRAQVMQAEAAGVEPSVAMNPILLKPTDDMRSQVIVNGEVVGTMSATDYFAYKQSLIPNIQKAYQSLADAHDIIVIEGAGSPAEINLKADDIVNMGIARLAKAPVLLVGDIDRGGVFASLYGTVKLLEPEEQDYIKAIVINKFRGNVDLLTPGLAMLEELVHIPTAGVVPYLHLDLDDEDSLSPRLVSHAPPALLDIAVIHLPRISNFTDFNPLSRYDGVTVRYVKTVAELGTPDLILLPGSKNTMADLHWMRRNGLEASILKLHDDGVPIIGICGGYQMLGREIFDPYSAEHGGTMRGMGLLPVETVFEQEKTRSRVEGTVQDISGFFTPLSGTTFSGYEIHMGKTQVHANPFSAISGGGMPHDGSASGAVFGSYVHGIFDSGTLAPRLIQLLLEQRGQTLDPSGQIPLVDYKNQQYDKLAQGLRGSLDMKLIYRILEEGIS